MVNHRQDVLVSGVRSDDHSALEMVKERLGRWDSTGAGEGAVLSVKERITRGRGGGIQQGIQHVEANYLPGIKVVEGCCEE
jgi:hypothetical protein